MAQKKSRPTFTKLARQVKLRERRIAKEARREARKHVPAEGGPVLDEPEAPVAETGDERPES